MEKKVVITKITEYRPDTIIRNEDIESDLLHIARKEIRLILDSGESKAIYKYYGTHLEELKRKGIEDPIFHKVGIESRYSVDGKETATDMVIKSTRKLLEKVVLDSKQKLAFITGTLSAEDRYPSVSAKAMKALGILPENGYKSVVGYDISAACSGWTFAIDDARLKLLYGNFKNAIVCSTDTMSQLVDKYDKSRMLFGDAATAAHLEVETPESTGFRIINTDTTTIAQNAKDVYYPTELSIDIPDENMRNKMNLKGETVYKAGVKYSADFINEYLNRNSITLENFDYIIPHQANGNMLRSLEKVLSLGKNRYGNNKMLSNIQSNGNTAASSIPLCLFDYQESSTFKDKDRILMCSFGAGYTLGIVDVEYKA